MGKVKSKRLIDGEERDKKRDVLSTHSRSWYGRSRGVGKRRNGDVCSWVLEYMNLRLEVKQFPVVTKPKGFKCLLNDLHDVP